MKYLATLLLLTLSLCAIAAEGPKNIIMVIGDGMGPAYTSAYRYFADDKTSATINTTVFDRNLVGMASTYPARVSGYVTDSAAGATALSSGHKSYNGAIAVDVDKKEALTVLEWAKGKGMKTGIAVTSQINHATPAAFSSHNESRKNYNQIADSYFDDRIEGKFVLDVMLGGGRDFFIREDRNIVEEFKKSGYQYVDDLDQLSGVEPSKPLLGLFGKVGMPWALDSKNKTRLPLIAKTAVKQLENENGFFLLIEASQVDWAGHANDIASAMAEMDDLAKTMEYLEAYVASNPDTLVVLTADHSTGGLSIAANGDYVWKPDDLKQFKASAELTAKSMAKSDMPAKLAEENLGFALTKEERTQLMVKDSDPKVHFINLKNVINARTNTGWTSDGHTAVDVQIFAMGKHKELFAGHMDNTEIAKKIFTLLGKK